MGDMNRDFFYEKDLLCGTTLEDANAVAFHDFSSFFVQAKTGSTITEFHVYVSGALDGEYTLGVDEEDLPMEKTGLTAPWCRRCRPGVFPALFIKILNNIAGGVLNVFRRS